LSFEDRLVYLFKKLILHHVFGMRKVSLFAEGVVSGGGCRGGINGVEGGTFLSVKGA